MYRIILLFRVVVVDLLLVFRLRCAIRVTVQVMMALLVMDIFRFGITKVNIKKAVN